MYPSNDPDGSNVIEGPINTSVLVHTRTNAELQRLGKHQFTFFDYDPNHGARLRGSPVTLSWLNAYLYSEEGMIRYGQESTSVKLAERFVPAGVQANIPKEGPGPWSVTAITRGRIVMDGILELTAAIGNTPYVGQWMYLMFLRYECSDNVKRMAVDAGKEVPAYFWQVVPYASHIGSHCRRPPSSLYGYSPAHAWRGHCVQIGVVRHIDECMTDDFTSRTSTTASRVCFPVNTPANDLVGHLARTIMDLHVCVV
jgi:hypothetical protein